VELVLVEIWEECWIVFFGEIAEEQVEGMDVVESVIGRKGNGDENNLDVRAFERG
jgi:hypothetical protein